MALNNFEKNIQEQLGKRELPPSTEAWEKLNAMLTVAEEKQTKKKTPFWWYVAASLTVFFTVGMFFIVNTNDKEQTQPQEIVVKEPIKDSVNTIESPAHNQPNKLLNNLPNNTQITLETKKKHTSNQSIINQKTNSIHNEMVQTNEVVTQINQPKEPLQEVDYNQVLDKVKEQTLANSETEKIKVNANALLQSVDTKTKQKEEYPEGVFAKINRNATYVKTAFVNRNRE